MSPTIAVLALQGAFIEHEQRLQSLGCTTIELRQAADLARPFDGLVLPGGESTVQAKLLHDLGMFEPLRQRIAEGLPALGTCAGLILLADHFRERPGTFEVKHPERYSPTVYRRRSGVQTPVVRDEITPAFRLLESTSQNPTAELRAAILSLDGDEPAAVVRRYDDTDLTTLAVKAAADLGPLFLDGLADGIRILDDRFTEAQLRDVELMILQAARVRFSHTEYIACPSCGRTLYDIEGTLAQIKARTSHLKNLKIGVMGCIVNGPGEMADADYGYVGAAPGRITLYKGRTVVERNIPQEEALDRLIALIRENGDWQEPE